MRWALGFRLLQSWFALKFSWTRLSPSHAGVRVCMAGQGHQNMLAAAVDQLRSCSSPWCIATAAIYRQELGDVGQFLVGIAA